MQADPPRTHYQTLGVAAECTAEEIKAAYRRLIRQAHPDVAGPDGAARAAELSAAYAVLSRPDRRQAYDDELRDGLSAWGDRTEPDPDFADEWGTPDDWQQEPPPAAAAPEETLDDVEVDEAGTGPDTAPETGSAATSGDFDWVGSDDATAVQVRTPIRRWAWVAAAGLALVIAAALWSWLTWTPGAMLTTDQAGAAAVIVPVVGIAVGYLLHDRVPLTAKAAGIAAVVVIIAGEVAAQPPWQSSVRLLYVLALAVALGLLLQQLVDEQRQLNAVLGAKALRENNIFGSLSGDVGSELLQRDCDPLYSIPAVRIIRTPSPDALFSHAVVCGDKVAFVRAVVAAGGRFRWSGPTLFRDGADGWPSEVIRGDYQGAARQLPAIMGKSTQVGLWVLIYPPDRREVSQDPDPLMPAVQDPRAGIDAIGHFLTADNELELVDQQRVVTAANTLFG